MLYRLIRWEPFREVSPKSCVNLGFDSRFFENRCTRWMVVNHLRGFVSKAHKPLCRAPIFLDEPKLPQRRNALIPIAAGLKAPRLGDRSVSRYRMPLSV